MNPRLFLALLLSLAMLSQTLAQDEPTDPCDADYLATQHDTLTNFLRPDFSANYDRALANLFRLGALYQSTALRCGFTPNATEIDAMLEQTLRFASLEDMIAAQSVGSDIDRILIELQDTTGDPLKGQALYNGLEPALGGLMLGCAGCHENEAVAPLTAGTWTRVNDLRLPLPQFQNYSHQQYLVESILQPTAYLPPNYASVMPDFYGSQLNTAQLADLLAFLDSQDQLLTEE